LSFLIFLSVAMLTRPQLKGKQKDSTKKDSTKKDSSIKVMVEETKLLHRE